MRHSLCCFMVIFISLWQILVITHTWNRNPTDAKMLWRCLFASCTVQDFNTKTALQSFTYLDIWVIGNFACPSTVSVLGQRLLIFHSMSHKEWNDNINIYCGWIRNSFSYYPGLGLKFLIGKEMFLPSILEICKRLISHLNIKPTGK